MQEEIKISVLKKLFKLETFRALCYNGNKGELMAEITGITPQVKDKTRCNIEVDGRFYCGMKLETVMQNRLKVGMIVRDEELSRIQLESEKMTALDKALGHISASMKTEKEIREYLSRKGYLTDVCDYVVLKMKDYGFLDDEAYSAAFAESAGKKKGRRLIAAELRRKGVSEENVEHALESLTNEAETAKGILEKYLRGKPLDQKNIRKGYAYLIGKGFDYETARSALRAFGETDDED